MFSYVSTVCPFSLLCSIPLFGWASVYLPIYLCCTSGFFPVLSYWKIKLLLAFMWESLYRHRFSFLLVKYLGVEWLGHMVSVDLILKQLPVHFPKWLYHVTFPPVCNVSVLAHFSTVSIFNFRHFSRCMVLSHCCFHWRFPSYEWHRAYLSFILLLWWNLCPVPFPTYKTGLCAFFLLILRIYFFNILGSSLLSGMWSAGISSSVAYQFPSLGCPS